MISVLINGEKRTVPDDIGIDKLMELFSLPRLRIAIELNNTVVHRVDWRGTVLHDGDKIEVVHFVGGG